MNQLSWGGRSGNIRVLERRSLCHVGSLASRRVGDGAGNQAGHILHERFRGAVDHKQGAGDWGAGRQGAAVEGIRGVQGFCFYSSGWPFPGCTQRIGLTSCLEGVPLAAGLRDDRDGRAKAARPLRRPLQEVTEGGGQMYPVIEPAVTEILCSNTVETCPLDAASSYVA